MRIHVPFPKLTTVSVNDDLMALLGAALVLDQPELHADAKQQTLQARNFVRSSAERHGDQSSNSLSSSVQRDIFRRIANPHALAILEARDTEDARAKAAAAYLEKCAINGWLTPDQVIERKRKKALMIEAKKQRRAREAMKKLLATGTGN